MTDVNELLESTRSVLAERPVPAFDDVVRRHRRATRRRLAAGSAAFAVAGAAGAGVYLALPGADPAPAAPAQLAAATAGGADSRPAPQLAGDGACSSLQVTDPSATGGQPDPVAAAQQFGRDGAGGYPAAGWHVTYQSGNVAQVESGAADAVVLRGPDGTWHVLAAQRCS